MASGTTILIPATDPAASRDLYRDLLGTDATTDEPYYVGFDVKRDSTSGWFRVSAAFRPHLHVDHMHKAVQRVLTAGGSVVDDPEAVGGGQGARRDPSTDPPGRSRILAVGKRAPDQAQGEARLRWARPTAERRAGHRDRKVCRAA